MGAGTSRRPSGNLPSASTNTDLIRNKKQSQIDRVKQTSSFQHTGKENTTLPKTKLIQWPEDEKSIRAGTCSFHVKYLGSIEAQDSRGAQICEQAIQVLLNQKRKHIKAVLHISGDALRVADGNNKVLIVDQTLEKVSFCVPDHQEKKAFTYISRDGTTRRWLCHGFLGIQATGERLSHAVGCAFRICLERKQKRVTVPRAQNDTRFGSYRTTSLTELPIPCVSNEKNYTIERPRPKGNNSNAVFRSVSMCSGDFNQTTIAAFKRQNSLSFNDLPSIDEPTYKDSLTNSISEEVEPTPTDDLFKKSLCDSTNTNLDIENFSSTSPQSIKTSIDDALDSNLTALAQSNLPTNPFSPYAYSVAAQAQSPNSNSRQSVIFTPKRGTNPFDDDLLRR